MEFVGRLGWYDTDRLNRGEITAKEALGIAAESAAADRRRFEHEMAQAREARERNRAWIASWARCDGRAV